MSRRSEMTEDIEAIEAGLLAARAYRRFNGHWDAVGRGAYRDGGINAQFEIDERAGVRRLASLIVQRMRGLGLQPVLDNARDYGEVSETWTDEFCTRLARVNVPED